ncbi:hypothetical protein AB6A40_002046 [Gnathostoma spinigerum]|uniref:Uncharacterized protein n=1 Tax=Gnathostoma spinigerum TaxID=75299 RepID=A0ABD6EFL8_9BILA
MVSRTWIELGGFGLLIIGMHYGYYAIQMNENLIDKNHRQELFYVRWLKKKFPSLKKYGIPEEDDHHAEK